MVFTCLAWWKSINELQKHDNHILLFLSNGLHCLVVSLIHKLPNYIRQNITEYIGKYHTKEIAYQVLMRRYAIVFTPPNIISYYKYIQYDEDENNQHNIQKIYYSYNFYYDDRSHIYARSMFKQTQYYPQQRFGSIFRNNDADNKIKFWKNKKQDKITYNSQLFFKDSIDVGIKLYDNIINYDISNKKWIYSHYSLPTFSLEIDLPINLITIIVEYILNPFISQWCIDKYSLHKKLRPVIKEYLKFPIHSIYIYENEPLNMYTDNFGHSIVVASENPFTINKKFSSRIEVYGDDVYPTIMKPNINSCKSIFEQFFKVYGNSVTLKDITDETENNDDINDLPDLDVD